MDQCRTCYLYSGGVITAATACTGHYATVVRSQGLRSVQESGVSAWNVCPYSVIRRRLPLVSETSSSCIAVKAQYKTITAAHSCRGGCSGASFRYTGTSCCRCIVQYNVRTGGHGT